MMFYGLAALLTILLLAIVLWPAWRRGKSAEPGDERAFDLEVYKDQLRELDADVARGAIDAAQAEYARAEIGRRILAVDAAAKSTASRFAGAGTPVLAAMVVFVPLATALVYSVTGSPGLPAQPLAARGDEQRRQITAGAIQGMGVEELVARAEEQLARNPEDGRGWDVLAPMYLRLGRPADARVAYERAIAILGESAARRSGLGQAHFMVAGGSVNDDARAAFARALEIENSDNRARFFLALGAAQDGDTDAAVSGWQALIADTATAPQWQSAANEALRRFSGEAIAGTPDSTAPALDEEAVRDVQAMDAEDQQAMILSMVETLDARLRDEPDDLAGWQRLIRSYAVLGREDDAKAAVSRAIAVFADDQEKRGQIAEFAAALGFTADEAVQ